METYIKSFQISNIIYDANTRKLTFEFDTDGSKSRRVHLGVRTVDNITEDFKKILQENYIVESES